MRLLPIARSLILAAFPMLIAAQAAATEQEVVRDGKTEYDEHCVACHGEKAKGDGRMAEILTIKPANLTEISKRNGGAYPFWQVYFTIEGTVPVRGHLYMPDWGTRFKGDESKPGYPPAYLRILTLTHYLETIQEK